jgi:hypothetical protein
MDKPADPATPIRKVYQQFLAVLRMRRRRARVPSRSGDDLAHLPVRRQGPRRRRTHAAQVDFETGILAIEDGKGDKDRQAFVQRQGAD